MPSEQQQQRHFGGFWNRTLNKLKSKSNEQLGQLQQSQHLDPSKRALSSRDLSSGAGFEHVIAELQRQPQFNCHHSDQSKQTAALEPQEESKEEAVSPQSKKHSGNSVHFGVKYAVNKVSHPIMSVVVAPPPLLTSSPFHEALELEQTLQNIKTKLKELYAERIDMENRVDSLYEGIDDVYSQYCGQDQPYPYPLLQSSCYPSAEKKTHQRTISLGTQFSTNHDLDLLPKDRNGERYLSNVRHNFWKQGATHPGDPEQNEENTGPKMPPSPPLSPQNSHKVVSFSSGGMVHHKLTTTTTPPTSPLVQEQRMKPAESSMTDYPHSQGMEQHLYHSTGAGVGYHTRSQPEPIINSTIYESGSPSGKQIKPVTQQRMISPISKIAILKRRSSVSELTQHSTKSQLLTRKTSCVNDYGVRQSPNDLSFSKLKKKKTQSWSFDA